MKARGLVFGNSHIAALRLVWRNDWQRWPDLDLDFAATHGDGQADLKLDGHIIAPRSDKVRQNMMRLNGKDAFDLRPYDFFVVCGGGPSVFHAVKLYGAARWIGLPSMTGFNPSALQGYALLSRDAFLTALTMLMRETDAYGLARTLAGMPARLVIVIPQPRLSLDGLRDSRRYRGFVQMRENGDADVMSAMLDAAAIAALDGLAHVLLQPAHTRHDGMFTDPQYRYGATRLAATDNLPQPDDDYLHANAAYGGEILHALYAFVTAKGGLPSAT